MVREVPLLLLLLRASVKSHYPRVWEREREERASSLFLFRRVSPPTTRFFLGCTVGRGEREGGSSAHKLATFVSLFMSAALSPLPFPPLRQSQLFLRWGCWKARIGPLFFISQSKRGRGKREQEMFPRPLFSAIFKSACVLYDGTAH